MSAILLLLHIQSYTNMYHCIIKQRAMQAKSVVHYIREGFTLKGKIFKCAFKLDIDGYLVEFIRKLIIS